MTEPIWIRWANSLIAWSPPVTMECAYTNWRGEKSIRRFRPQRVWIGSTEYHPEIGVMLTAWDLGKSARRDFRFSDFDIKTLEIEEGQWDD